jgi:hypothetical protein
MSGGVSGFFFLIPQEQNDETLPSFIKEIKSGKRCHSGSGSRYWPAVYLAD